MKLSKDDLQIINDALEDSDGWDDPSEVHDLRYRIAKALKRAGGDDYTGGMSHEEWMRMKLHR